MQLDKMEDKIYTEQEVQNLVRGAITQSIKGYIEYMEKECDIVDKDTKKVLDNVTVELKPERRSMAAFILTFIVTQ